MGCSVKNSNLEASRILADLRMARISRRQALRALGDAGVTAAALPFLGGTDTALADSSGQLMGPGGIPLARPDHSVTLPIFEDPIKSGLKPETGGTFNVFNYADYIDKKLLDAFGKKYGVNVRLTVFDSMDQAITKLANKSVQVDVTEITSDRLAQAVAGKLLKPINHDYIPNLAQNVWPSLQSPFYDVGSLYTVPYTIYTTGIGWRSDKIAEDIHKLDNPWSIFWNAQKYKGYMAILDDSRESLAMPKINITSYQTLPQGNSWLNPTWSGQMLSAVFAFLPKGTDPSVLQYWAAPKGKGPIQNDMWAVCSTTTKPVLAHLFLNFLLDQDNAYNNFVNFTGYQPPQNSITAESLIAKNVIPPNLSTAIISPDDFGPTSLQESQLTNQGLKLWQAAYARFNAGG